MTDQVSGVQHSVETVGNGHVECDGKEMEAKTGPKDDGIDGVANGISRLEMQETGNGAETGERNKDFDVMILETRFAEFEVSVHAPTGSLVRELKLIFKSPIEEHKLNAKEIHVIPTIQRTKMKLMNWSDEAAREKDACLEKFMEFAEYVCTQFKAKGYWADYCDPCSGLPFHSPSSAIYAEIQGLEKLRRFQTVEVGGCRIAIHPSYGTSMYPATMFTNAPREEIISVFESTKENSS